MNMTHNKSPSIALALSFFAHVALFWLWRASMMPGTQLAETARVIELRLLPPVVTPRAPVSRQSAATAGVSAPTRRATEATVPARSVARDLFPSTSDIEQAAPTVLITPDAQDLISNAKRDIGHIDRELRRANPSRSDLMPATPESLSAKLEKRIAAAGTIRTTTMQEIRLADGRRYTKVTTPTGTYCVWARDANQSAATIGTTSDVNVRMTTCST